MPVGYDEEVEQPPFARLCQQLPSATRPMFGMDDAVLKFDVALEVKGSGVVLEILLDERVVWKVRVAVWHREVPKRKLMPRGVDVQRAVGTAVSVRIAEGPVSAYPIRGLETRMRNPVIRQHLYGGESADAGSDDCGTGSGHGPPCDTSAPVRPPVNSFENLCIRSVHRS